MIGPLFTIPTKPGQPLIGQDRVDALATVIAGHYTHSVPSGKTYVFRYKAAIVLFSIPANCNIAKFLFGRPAVVWELTRLWAPNGHEPNLLTAAIAQTVRYFHQAEPSVEALVSYADPNAGHLGGVYRAASWLYLGQCEESRRYVDKYGTAVARRAFHSGKKTLAKVEIESAGYRQERGPGKFRFCLPLNRRARKELKVRWNL